MAAEPTTTAPDALVSAVEHGLRAPFRPLTPQSPRWTLAERMVHYQVPGGGPCLPFQPWGANQGYRAFLMAFPATGHGLAVMTNADNGDVLAVEILQSVSVAYDWPSLGLTG